MVLDFDLHLYQQIQNTAKEMKSITTTKYNRVENTDLELLNQGIVAFQLVKFEINFFGRIIETTHDTKIMEDGSQVVIGGCGFIKEGFLL